MRSLFDRKMVQLNAPSKGKCDLCEKIESERKLTRIFEPKGWLDICKECCTVLGKDSIADLSDNLMFVRWDRFPYRPEDY